MGGGAVKSLGFEARRIPNNEISSLIDKVKGEFGHLFFELECVKSYHDKPDHGDIDLVGVLRPETANKWEEKIKAGGHPLFWNAPVASIFFDGAQIDISGCSNPVDARTRLDFCHYSPIGNVVGKMIKQTGAKWGIDGLSYPVRDSLSGDGEVRGVVVLSKDVEAAFDLAGLPLEPWVRGFNAQQDIFAWATSSRLFNREIFAFENMNHANRKRDRLRSDYHDWIAFSGECPNRYPRPETEEQRARAKESWFVELSRRFPFLDGTRDKILKDHRDLIGNRGKLNGDLVMEWTGLKGKALGEAFSGFKKSLGGGDFDGWLSTVTHEDAKRVFLEHWKGTKLPKGLTASDTREGHDGGLRGHSK